MVAQPEPDASAPADEPRIGSDDWQARCRELYRQKATYLAQRLSEYEDVHPKDAVCLLRSRDEAIAALADGAA